MGWTIEEIQREWFDGGDVHAPSALVTRAFDRAEEVRGRDWVLATTRMTDGGRSFGFAPFALVYRFGQRLDSLDGAQNAEDLLNRLRDPSDHAAESELAALHLLRSRNGGSEVTIPPAVQGHRRADFHLRQPYDHGLMSR
jgi:hypothetical protein